MAKHKLLQFTFFLITLSSFAGAEFPTANSRQLDETTPPDLSNKCGNCPCDTPCNPPPSPPPPSPSPPPPSPSPPKNPDPNINCPPPPSPPSPPSSPSSPSPPSSPSGQKPPDSPYIYINGPPGSVYPVYPYYADAGRRFSTGIFPFLFGNVLWMLAF